MFSRISRCILPSSAKRSQELVTCVCRSLKTPTSVVVGDRSNHKTKKDELTALPGNEDSSERNVPPMQQAFKSNPIDKSEANSSNTNFKSFSSKELKNLIEEAKYGAEQLDSDFRLSLLDEEVVATPNDSWTSPPLDAYDQSNVIRPEDTHNVANQFETVSPTFSSWLSSGNPLNIFTCDLSNEYNSLKFWKAFDEVEIKMLNYVTPTNFWEEMIKLTEEGKLWTFPIDNEQGVESEELDKDGHVESFEDHLMLEESEAISKDQWINSNPDVRDFLDVVIVGLGKNRYMTVDDKRQHLNWFLTYLKSKADIFEAIKS